MSSVETLKKKKKEELEQFNRNVSFPTVENAAVFIYTGEKAEKWWDTEKLIKQVKESVIPIFNLLHPNIQGVFVFDCSLAHEAYGPTAIRVQNMNIGPGSKQSKLCNTIIPSNDHNIPAELWSKPQAMIFPPDYHNSSLARKAKVI